MRWAEDEYEFLGVRNELEESGAHLRLREGWMVGAQVRRTWGGGRGGVQRTWGYVAAG